MVTTVSIGTVTVTVSGTTAGYPAEEVPGNGYLPVDSADAADCIMGTRIAICLARTAVLSNAYMRTLSGT
jgi:hypothetical protein